MLLTEHSLGSMCVLFDDGGGGKKKKKKDGSDCFSGGTAAQTKIVANIINRRQLSAVDPTTSHTTTTTSSSSSSSSSGNVLKNEVAYYDYDWPPRALTSSPEELCRLQRLVPRSMREWSCLLSRCSELSHEISSSNNSSSSRSSSVTLASPPSSSSPSPRCESEEDPLHFQLIQTLRAMYANLDRASVALGAEALLQMYVKEKVDQLA